MNEYGFFEITSLFTAEALKKRIGEELNVKRAVAPAKQAPSTFTGLFVRNEPEKEPTIPVPTETIIAFGDSGKNEIWRRGTNKWTKWEMGRDCGKWFACVKAHSNIYLIGGWRGEEQYSTETDTYDMAGEQWSKGPQLNEARLEV